MQSTQATPSLRLSLRPWRRVFALSVAVMTAACSPGVPSSPTWAEDVAPILAANCVRCHTVPAIGGAPDGFRLDTYDDWVMDDGTVIRGAGTMASGYIDRRIVHDDDPMPPPFASLSDRQIDVLTAWAASRDSDGRAVRGGARPGNQEPDIAILSKTDTDGVLVIEYELRDPDHEIVLGELSAEGPGGAVTLTRELHSGRGQVRWNTSAFPDGTYQLSAALSDPSGTYTRAGIDTHEIANGGNIAPTVRVISPTRDSLIAAAESEQPAITLFADDPDAGDTLTATITAHLGDRMVSVATDEPVLAGMENAITWDISSPDAVPEGLSWHLEVTVSDGTAQTTVRTGEFIIGRRSLADTDDTFDTISTDVLSSCTFCHPGADPAKPFVPGLTHSLIDYMGTPDALGVHDLRGIIFRRAVQQRNMPPVSVNIRLTDDQVTRLENWLLAGAPL